MSGGPRQAGHAGLIATAASVTLAVAVAAAGPSVMEPVLPGRAGQPPWAFNAHPSPYLAVGLTAAALGAGVLGLVLTQRAIRGGWSVPARAVLLAGLLAAAVLTLVPPFGSSDQLSYAAYGRMLVTGHNPYTTTPAQLAALGDPVARAVQDWFTTPSVYGPLATGVQGLASLTGGTSVRLTVFVLGLANLTAFAITALLLHHMTRGDPVRQLRAALLWAANPLLLLLLIGGAHVDAQAVAFGVAAIAVMYGPWAGPRAPVPSLTRSTLAGVLVGLGFAVKVSDVLVGLGLAVTLVLGLRSGRRLLPPLAGLAAGFSATAGAAIAIGGPALLGQLSRESNLVSIVSPWRVIRILVQLAAGGTAATDMVKAGAIALAVLLAVVFIRALPGPAEMVVFAVVLAWLFAWPYVLPWYDALAWALLPLVPWGAAAADGICWLLLARTAALGFGYLPARQADAALPGGLSWLQPVIRHGVTPAILTAAAVWLAVLMLRTRRTGRLVPTETTEAQLTATRAP
jgi:alpha-1,6-mannosyltransferase